jgi:uncharacterized protein YecT (DUF1311 family)
MRVVVLALTIVLAPAVALAGTDIVASCYKDCENATHSNPEYKACLARAADKADAALNQAYKTLQDKIRAAAKDMGQPADTHLEDLKSSQNIGSPSATRMEDNLAFGGTAIGGNYSSCLCALSYERIDDFARIGAQVLGEP